MSPSQPRPGYRPEIDGLRAVAVLLVVLFHVGVPSLEGGYVGVDVFFAISGYLITRNIAAETETFSFGRFYLRRLRRLFPALLATATATMVASAAIMSADDAAATAGSAIAAVFSVSNILFWLESGYWDVASDMKPLLHTWSLGVEEQFYFLWPALIIFVAVRDRRLLAGAFGTIAVFGFFGAEATLSAYPSATFYLTPFRFAEFAVGALLAVAADRVAALRRPVWSTCAAVVGLGAIGYAGLTFGEGVRFPGLNAIYPSLGAVLVIASAGGALRPLLANPAAVYLGKVSYSLYLTHWPIIVLYRYTNPGVFSAAEQAGLVLASGVSAVALHHLVEAPLRFSKSGLNLNDRAFLVRAAVVTFIITACLLVFSHGIISFEPRREDVIMMTRDEANADRLIFKQTECGQICLVPDSERLNILILGDSHALDAYTMARAARPEANVMFGGRASCMVLYGAREHLEKRAKKDKPGLRGAALNQCAEHVERVFGDRAMLAETDIIVMNFFFSGTNLPLLEPTLSYLGEMTDAKVIIMGNAVIFKEFLPNIVRRNDLSLGDAVPADAIDPVTYSADVKLAEIAERYDAVFLSKTEILCPERRCDPFFGSYLISYDKHHLSRPVAEELGRELLASVLP